MLEIAGTVIPKTDPGKASAYPPGELTVCSGFSDVVGSYEEAEESVRAYRACCSIGTLRLKMLRTCFPDLSAGPPMGGFEAEIPSPAFRAASVVVLVAGSLLVVATWSEPCGLLIADLDEVVTLEGKGSTLGRLCLPREKKEEDDVGILEALGAEDAMGDLDGGPTDIFSFDSALPGCFADLKPNAPREAIVAAWLAKPLNNLRRWRT